MALGYLIKKLEPLDSCVPRNREEQELSASAPFHKSVNRMRRDVIPLLPLVITAGHHKPWHLFPAELIEISPDQLPLTRGFLKRAEKRDRSRSFHCCRYGMPASPCTV